MKCKSSSKRREGWGLNGITYKIYTRIYTYWRNEKRSQLHFDIRTSNRSNTFTCIFRKKKSMSSLHGTFWTPFLTIIPACFASSSAEHGCWVLMKLSKIPALYPNPNTRAISPSLTTWDKTRGSNDAIVKSLTQWESHPLYTCIVDLHNFSND